MTTLPDFFTMIAQRRALIKGKMAQLRAELNALKVAEEAYRSGSSAAKVPSNDAPVPGTKMTIKELVVDVLSESEDGADAHEIIALIAKKHNVIIQRPSLSPQLSRLKSDGLLELHGSVWRAARPTKKGSDNLSEPSISSGAGHSDGRSASHLSSEGASPSRSTSLAQKLLSSSAVLPRR